MCRLVLWMSGVVLALGAVAASGQDVREFVSDYLPLKEGTKWVYALGKKEVTITVEQKERRKIMRKDDKGDKKEELVRCWRLQIVSGDKKLTEVVAVLDDGIYRFESAGKVITPPVCYFKLQKLADRWECDSDSENVKLTGTFVRTVEAVTVPVSAVPLQAYKASCANFKIGDQTMSIEYWFVPNYGMVKQRIKMENHDDLVLELKEFVPSK